MILNLDTERVRTLAKVRAFLDGSDPVVFRLADRDDAYALVRRTLVRFRYAELDKPGKGLLRRYLGTSPPEVKSVTQPRINPPTVTQPATAATSERTEASEPRTEAALHRSPARSPALRPGRERCGAASRTPLRRPTNTSWKVRTADGWQIDVASVALVSSTSSKSAYHGVSDLSEDAFAINGRVSNDGECVTVVNKQVARDVPGNSTVSEPTTRYDRFWTLPRRAPRPA